MSDFRVVIDDRNARALMREFPKITNQEQNKAYRGIAGDFGRILSKEVFGRTGVFRVRRPDQVRSPPRGQPRLPKKVRLAGIKAELGNPHKLKRKFLSIRTRNPLLLIRESGGTIRPKRGKYLAAHFKRRGRRRKNVNTDYELRLVRQITVRPQLGFVSRWSRQRGAVLKRLEKAMIESVRRAERKLARVRSK